MRAAMEWPKMGWPKSACVVASLATACNAGPGLEAGPRISKTAPAIDSDRCPRAANPVDSPPVDDTPVPLPDYRRCEAGDLSWSADTQELLVEGKVRCSLSELWALDGDRAPQPVDDATSSGPSRTWFARYGLTLRRGAVLELHGSAYGGDVDELRLRSDPGPVLDHFTTAAPGVFAALRASWGGIDLLGVRVHSWDSTANEPDRDPSDGRAYIAVRSVYSEGEARETRMDVRDSELSYLGYHAAESYGVVWRIPDGDSDGAPLFDVLNVYGDILDSHLHHNYFGAYTFGAYGMRVRRSEFDHNVEYGFDPHDDSDALIVEDNQFHDNGKHGFICSKRCDQLQLRRNQSNDNAANGYMLHSENTDWIVEGNEAAGNGGGGIVLFESSRNVIRGNRLWNNKNGIVLLSGSSDNLVEGNEIGGSTSYGIYAYLQDPPLEGDGHCRRNQVRNNVLVQGLSKPIKLQNADDNRFENNRVVDHASTGIVINGATGNQFVGNCIPDGLTLASTDTSDASSATIAEEGSIKASLAAGSQLSLEDSSGALFDAHDGRVTTLTPAGSAIDVLVAPTGAKVHIVRVPVSIVPDTGSASAHLHARSTAGFRISLSPTTAAQSFQVTIAGLPVAAGYRAAIDGTVVATGSVDPAGVATFLVTSADGGPFTLLFRIR